MASYDIWCPAELDYANSLEYTRQLRDAPPADTYVFVFTRLKRVEPFGMLLAASALRAFQRSRKNQAPDVSFQCAGIETNQSAACSYAAHVGFWQSANISYGLSPGEASGNHSYLPITRLPVEDLRRKSVAKGAHVVETVMDKARSVARILTRSTSGPLFDSIAYSVREIIRNIVEHSRAATVWLCGQYQAANSRTEVAILDEGVGVTETFWRRSMIAERCDRLAIVEALKPGVTTAVRPSREIDEFSWEDQGYGLDPGRYDNEGYGLYLTDCICQQLGKFALATGSTAVERSAGGHSWSACAHQGTAVRIRFNGDGIHDLQQRLDGWVRSSGGEVGGSGSGMSLSSRRYQKPDETGPAW